MTARTWSVMAVAITGLMIQIVWAQQAVTPIGPLPDEATLVAPFGEANRLADRPEISPPAPPNASAPPAMAPSLVAHVRRRLGDDAVRGGRHTRDKAALQAFYGAGDATLLWVGGEGVRQLAHDVVAEIGRADDYGLETDAFALPALQVEPSPGALAAIELELSRAVLGYARHARGGRVVGAKLGSQLVDRPVLLDPLAVLWALRSSPDKAAYLRSLHPIHPQFAGLRKKLMTLRMARGGARNSAISAGPILRRGQPHPNVPLLRARLGLAQGGDETFDAALETAVKRFQAENDLSGDGVVGAGTRAALNADTDERQRIRILVNMERWRWLPQKLNGEAGIYVWVNIPEFRVRVVKGGAVVFAERAIAGKVDKKTPVFSDQIEWIEFHPTWYVPNSIKAEDILPSLRRNSSRIMTRYHLAMDCGRHGRDSAAIDWNQVDIRSCAFSQPPGEKSVLGEMKFKFPNRHAVYMHDTLLTRLFGHEARTFSHGCIRVKNPRRLAEVLLGHDKGMMPEVIGSILAGPKRLHKETFRQPVPVHITYFTARIGETGALVNQPDYYGHDARLAQVLFGKGHLLPAVSLPSSRRVRAVRRPPPPRKQEWWEQVTMQN